MFKRSIGFSIFVFFICIEMLAVAQEGYTDMVMSEKLFTEIDTSTYIPNTLKVSPNMQRAAYIAEVNDIKFVVVDGISGQYYTDIKTSSLKFSKDSKHFAYIATIGNEQFVVTDGLEEKQYNRIITNPIFSPDSKKVAYVAQLGNKQFVVVNGIEGEHYDEIINSGKGKIVFTSHDEFYYFAKKDDSIYLVEEKIK
jgi:hypothetical protein